MDHSYNLVVSISLGEFNVLMILVFKVNCSIKWNNPIMGEMEYPFKSYAEAEKNFEVAKREVHNHHATEAHVYEQGEGQRVPVMGIMSGKL